jgi:hypothetical protein
MIDVEAFSQSRSRDDGRMTLGPEMLLAMASGVFEERILQVPIVCLDMTISSEHCGHKIPPGEANQHRG